jgi:HPt (histidine-containing phosphotransfer) domain-containing protein
MTHADCDARALIGLRTLGGATFVGELIDLFLSYAPERIDAARACIAAGDMVGVARALHSLKSSAGQLGAVSMRDGCAQGEALAEQSAPALAAALAHVESVWPATRDWLIEQRQR